MLNITKSYATVWQVNPEEKRVKAKVTTSRKIKGRNGEPDRYANSSWMASFVGDALESARKLQERDRIIINNAVVTSEPQVDKSGNKILDDNGKSKYYLNLTVFSFDVNPNSKKNSTQTNSKPNPQTGSDTPDSDLPF